MLARARLALIVLAVAAAPSLALAQTPVESARALVARYHEDPTGIDRARALLEAAVARDPQVDTMVMLSFVHFLYGDVRATTTEDKLAAYDRGREIGKRAVELAPKNPEAHVWYGINTGRWGLTKGVMRSLFLLPTVRQEVDATLALDPRNLRALALSGNVFLEVPGLFGGDREKAEQQFRKALEIDPHFTVARVDLARVLIAGSRYADARRELQRVIDERTPNSIADWTAKDLPRARELLESIKGK
ncbi:MAG TPA: tetratricopeptide repeat protein [Candidatus Acidoferrum sp.]|jgi:tetratricopeptide (TPR) repeat protein|nr:tetratricopeptide repeat protein [Candidatus Acidoferrum sp.]